MDYEKALKVLERGQAKGLTRRHEYRSNPVTGPAITTEFFGPSNTRGARIKTTYDTKSISISYPHELDTQGAHELAARTLANKMGWTGTLIGGRTKKGYCFVFANGPFGKHVFKKNPRGVRMSRRDILHKHKGARGPKRNRKRRYHPKTQFLKRDMLHTSLPYYVQIKQKGYWITVGRFANKKEAIQHAKVRAKYGMKSRVLGPK